MAMVASCSHINCRTAARLSAAPPSKSVAGTRIQVSWQVSSLDPILPALPVCQSAIKRYFSRVSFLQKILFDFFFLEALKEYLKFSHLSWPPFFMRYLNKLLVEYLWHFVMPGELSGHWKLSTSCWELHHQSLHTLNDVLSQILPPAQHPRRGSAGSICQIQKKKTTKSKYL